jgi:hypothetical protein
MDALLITTLLLAMKQSLVGVPPSSGSTATVAPVQQVDFGSGQFCISFSKKDMKNVSRNVGVRALRKGTMVWCGLTVNVDTLDLAIIGLATNKRKVLCRFDAILALDGQGQLCGDPVLCGVRLPRVCTG